MGRKKNAVHDKYYNLAKEQGYRARSSFKLVQLNRKYDLLAKTTKVIDLCAAPGGWLQVCLKNMPKTPERQIIGVDIMPIKPIPGCVTFQADITTEHCRQLIRKEMKGKAQVVLCDGAPNVGAEYSKDAFVQNELTVHALKFACEHLVKGGSFVTKVFRSSDYNSLMWAFQQLFKKVEATKPASSRNVSAEIFVVCRGYLAPHKIDPRLLDPKQVLDHVDQGNEIQSEKQAVGALFNKKGKQKKNRSGYDESLGQTLHRSHTAIEYIKTDEPIKMLATSNEITFKDDASKELLRHPATTEEIQTCLEDLKILGNSELRLVLRWRSQIRSDAKKAREALKAAQEKEEEEEEGESSSDDDDDDDSSSSSDSSDEDGVDDIEKELAKLRERKSKEKRRERKRKRKERGKRQRRIDLGMENDFVLDLAEESGPFSAKRLGVKSVKELSKLQDSLAALVESEDESEDEKEANSRSISSKEDYFEELEEQMETEHEIKSSKKKKLDPLSVQQRRQLLQAEKKAKMKKKTLNLLASQDFDMALEEEQEKSLEKGAYERMLAESSDEEDDDDEDSADDEMAGKKRRKSAAVLEKKANRWFEQPLFEGAESSDDDDDDDDEDEEEEQEEEDEESSEEESSEIGLPTAKTDKEKRREKRKKLAARNERKEEKRRLASAREAKLAGDNEAFLTKSGKEFETVSNPQNEIEDDDDENETKRPTWAKDLIERGMGNMKDVKESDGFQVVSADTPNNLNGRMDESSDEDSDASDEEKYDSEEYDDEERARHLALGSLMIKKSKRRKLLDSGYNRYAFNDDDDLPEWFISDENKHNRPQLPITKEMVEAVKARYKDLAAKPINKVAEARARKRRRLVAKVEKIKKQAAALVDQPDMTAKSKMRAIEKLYKGARVEKPSSVYVVADKGSKGKVNVGGKLKGKKVKVVDKRMKADQTRNKKKLAKMSKKKGGRRR